MNHGWEKKRLGDICIYQRGLTYSKDDEVDKSSKSVLRANNIDLETFTLNFDDLKYLREDFYIDPKYLLSKDSILICMSSGSKSHLGKVAFVERDFDYAFGGFMGLITPKTNSRYLYLFMTSPFFRSHLQKITNGININNLKFSTLQDLFVPLPNAEIQSKVVKELDRITVLIELKRNQLKDLDTLAQSLFYETFGDPIENPKGWETKPFGKLIRLKSGDALSAKNFCDGIYPVYGGNGIAGYHNKYNISGPNIIIGRVGALCGNVRLIDADIFVTDNAFIVNLQQDMNLRFLERLLTLLELRKYANAAAQPVISNTSLKVLNVPIPPISMQNEFAAKIEAIEEQKRLIESSISDLETLLASRMDYWFND